MCNEILYILLPDYAAHEVVYLSQAIASDEFSLKENPKYVNKVVAPTLEPVKSIGGFRTVPDYSFETMLIVMRRWCLLADLAGLRLLLTGLYLLLGGPLGVARL